MHQPDYLICEWRNCLRDADIMFMDAWLCLRHYMVVRDALETTAAADRAGGPARDLGVNLSGREDSSLRFQRRLHRTQHIVVREP